MGATEAGVILGTAAYMAPEQARGKRVDKRADIWAFGVVLYELLTGERVFQGEDVAETLAAVINKQPDFARVPAKAQRLIRTCLEKDPKKRLRDIGDAFRLLEEQPREAAPVARRRVLLPWIAVAVLAVVAVGAGWIGWSATRPTEKSVVRLDVDLGPGRTVRSIGGPDVVVSPDGTRLAYLSRDRIFTRRLDQSQGTELAGTVGAAGPVLFPGRPVDRLRRRGKAEKDFGGGRHGRCIVRRPAPSGRQLGRERIHYRIPQFCRGPAADSRGRRRCRTTH